MAPLSSPPPRRRQPSSRASAGILIALVAALLLGGESLPGETVGSREYQLKAVFLFNFVQFVDWPATAFAGLDAPLCLGVLGDDPFGAALDETVRGEAVRGRTLIVRRSRKAEELTSCHLIFISRPEKGRLSEILGDLEPFPILTVSEIEGFGRRGGAVNFYLDGNRVRFEINRKAAERHGLRISSELLRLGRIVESDASGDDSSEGSSKGSSEGSSEGSR